MSSTARLGFLLAPCLALLVLTPAGGQEKTAERPPEPPPLAVTKIAVTPEKPAAEALCQLRVTLENRGEKTATALRFRVAVGGRALAVYDKQLFMAAVPPGGKTEVRLYNFWTGESGRPAPADGKLAVEVTLQEASWVTIETDGSGEEVWTLGDPVPGLPAAGRLDVVLAGVSG